MSAYDEFGFETRAVRAGQRRTPEGEHAEAIFPTSSYVFGSAAEAAARFAGDQPGNIYSRFTNPTVRTFEERLASLEGGESCVATASGMAAILATCAGLLQAGDHIVSSHSIFGTTTVLFTNYLARFGIETSFVPLTDLAAWEASIRPNTRLLFLETPSNPLTEVADIAQLAALAQANDGRMHILAEMQKAIETPREDVSEFAPRYITMKIHPDKIRDVIGKGGATIRSITEETGASIDIDDSGNVKIASVDYEAGQEAKRRIELITADVEVGHIYEGRVAKLMDFGAFVTILPGKDGLVHISQICEERVQNVSDKLSEGDHVKVKVLEVDKQGRIRLSMKAVGQE